MKLSRRDKVDIIQAYELLETVQSLADKYNVTRQAIYKTLKVAGIDTSKRLLDVSCTTCGRLIKRNKGRVRRQKNHFCDQECYYAFLDAGNGLGPYIKDRHGQRIARRIVSQYFELHKDNVVHHEDKNCLNNLPYNLKVFASQGDHIRYHRGFDIDPIWDGRDI